jgi:hypothetical protein
MSPPILPLPIEILVCGRSSLGAPEPSGEFPLRARDFLQGEIVIDEEDVVYVRLDEVEQRVAAAGRPHRNTILGAVAEATRAATRSERLRIAHEILGPEGRLREARIASADALTLYGLSLLEDAHKDDRAAREKKDAP